MSGRWRILAALTFARTSMGFQFQSVAAVAPFLGADLGLDHAQMGWLIGIYLLPGIAIALPGGVLGARFGDKRMTLIGLALMTGGGLWLAMASTAAEAQAARIASGAGAVVLNVLFTKMVADWFEGRERVLAMSVLINAWPIGIGLALLSLGALAESTGWREAVVAAAAFAGVGFAAVLAFYRAPAPAAPEAAGIGLSTLDLREWRLLAIASLPWMLYNAAYQVVVSFLPAFLLESGTGVARSGVMTAVNTMLFIVSVQAGGVLLRRAARPDLLCHLGLVVWCASLVLLAHAPAPWLWIVVGGLIGGLAAGAFVNLPAEFLRPQSRGAGMGVFYTIYYVGCAILPTVAGYLADASGSARATLWLAALLVLACSPLLVLSRRAIATQG